MYVFIYLANKNKLITGRSESSHSLQYRNDTGQTVIFRHDKSAFENFFFLFFFSSYHFMIIKNFKMLYQQH